MAIERRKIGRKGVRARRKRSRELDFARVAARPARKRFDRLAPLPAGHVEQILQQPRKKKKK